MNPDEKERIVPIMNFWEKTGFERGEEKGIDTGRRMELVKAIRLGLKLRFGPDGLARVPLVEAIEDLDLLQKLFDALDSDASLDDIRRLLPSATNGQH